MLTTKEISQLLNVSEETVRRWIRNQELKAHQSGKSYSVNKNDLIEFVKVKATEGTTTSIGKMAKLLPVAEGIFAGGATSSVAKIIKMINSKTSDTKETEKKPFPDNIKNQSIDEIEEYIYSLERQRKKFELEYQMKLLEIDDEIAEYQKIKNKLNKEGHKDGELY